MRSDHELAKVPEREFESLALRYTGQRLSPLFAGPIQLPIQQADAKKLNWADIVSEVEIALGVLTLLARHRDLAVARARLAGLRP